MKTADLIDRHDDALRFCHLPQLRPYGGKRMFHGPIATAKVFEDNSLIRGTLEQPGAGRVLVVDGAGSTRVALVGDVLAGLARDNGWAGLVICGAVRDSAALSAMDIGVFALATSPKKSAKDGVGLLDVTVTFGNVDFVPGHMLYADDDGILVSVRALG